MSQIDTFVTSSNKKCSTTKKESCFGECVWDTTLSLCMMDNAFKSYVQMLCAGQVANEEDFLFDVAKDLFKLKDFGVKRWADVTDEMICQKLQGLVNVMDKVPRNTPWEAFKITKPKYDLVMRKAATLFGQNHVFWDIYKKLVKEGIDAIVVLYILFQAIVLPQTLRAYACSDPKPLVCAYQNASLLVNPTKLSTSMLLVPLLLKRSPPKNITPQAFLSNDNFMSGITDGYTTLSKKEVEGLLMSLYESAPKGQSNLDIQVLRAQSFVDTYLSLKFMSEIWGVINLKSWKAEKAPYFEKGGKLVPFSKEKDKVCGAKKNLGLEGKVECEKLPECIWRASSVLEKTCMNAERYSTFQGGSPTAYVMENPLEKKKFVVFKPLGIYYLITGNIGVFERQSHNPKGELFHDGYTITFPAFDTASITYDFVKQTAFTMFIRAYNINVKTKTGANVGVHQGYHDYLKAWYDTSVKPLNIKKDAHIYLVGISLGGALANVAAFILHNEGFTNIHLYAFGAPRVGDTAFASYMETKLSSDSYNYVAVKGIVKEEKCHLQYDPVCKFPPNTWSTFGYVGYHLRFADNPKLRGFTGGLSFVPTDLGYTEQPDYDMTCPKCELSTKTLIGSACTNHWGFVHSFDPYSYEVFFGNNTAINVGTGKVPVMRHIDEVVDLDSKACVEIQGSEDNFIYYFRMARNIGVAGTGVGAPVAAALIV